MRMIEDGIASEINGGLSHDVLVNLPIQSQFLATEESVIKFWNRRKKEFDEIFNNLKKIKYLKLESVITD